MADQRRRTLIRDAIFANVGINSADNMKLLENILELISGPKGA